jgi:hypothetical protein
MYGICDCLIVMIMMMNNPTRDMSNPVQFNHTGGGGWVVMKNFNKENEFDKYSNYGQLFLSAMPLKLKQL